MAPTSGAILTVSVLVATTIVFGMSYRAKTIAAWKSEAAQSWSVKELRRFLESRRLRSDVYAERKEMVEAVQEEILSNDSYSVYTGYTLLLVGYILFPALGIALVQRLHEQRLGTDGDRAFGEEDFRENIVYNPLPHTPLLQTRYWSGRSELQSLVNAATTISSGSLDKEGEEESCIICLATMEKAHKVRELRCGHRFHVYCCDAWLILRRKNWCPLCTTPVVDKRDSNMGVIVS